MNLSLLYKAYNAKSIETIDIHISELLSDYVLDIIMIIALPYNRLNRPTTITCKVTDRSVRKISYDQN